MTFLVPVPFLLWAVWTDMKERKIYNYTTYTLMAIGLGIGVYQRGVGEVAVYGGVALMLLMFLNMNRGQKLGGGDLKLILALGAFLQQDQILQFILTFLVLVALIGFLIFSRENGVRAYIQTIRHEIMTVGRVPTEQLRIVGAPLIAMAYLTTVFFGLLYG